MSDRPLIAPNLNVPLVNAVSMATTVTSPITNINRLPGLSYDLVWSGTPTGVFAVQVSNSAQFDSRGNYIAGTGNWNTLPSSFFTGTYPVPAGSAGNGFLDVIGTEAAYCRLVYTPSGGAGNLTVVVAAKVL